jgi:hypothetical protein
MRYRFAELAAQIAYQAASVAVFAVGFVLAYPASAGTTLYFYDSLGRVSGATASVGLHITSYKSDAADNRTSLDRFPLTPLSAQDTANAGQGILRYQALQSTNGQYSLEMQGDGNLVLYGPSGVLWYSNTHDTQAAYLIMQGDGNLVLYDMMGNVQWMTGTASSPGSKLVLQNDGNLCIYSASGTLVWDTAT